MAQMTVTEALAELKTLGKRIEKKRQFVSARLARPAMAKDPMEKDGGTTEVLRRELQAISDLERRIVALRMAIQRANQTTDVSVGGETQKLSEWLTWRKEVLPERKRFVGSVIAHLATTRTQWAQSAAKNPGDASYAAGVEFCVDEAAFGAEYDRLEQIEGGLDGQLSLKNATTVIDIAD